MSFFFRVPLYLALAFCALAAGGVLNGEALAAKRDDLRLAINVSFVSADPHGYRQLYDTQVLRQIYEGLYMQNELTREYEPRVAESYTVSDNNMIYTFKIRPNIKFHNGDPLKVSDIVFSLTRAMGMGIGMQHGRAIEKVEAVDENTVKVTLKSPWAPFMSDLPYLYILSEKEVRAQGENFGKTINFAGTGPYRWKSLDRAVEWSLEAFPDYYRGPAPIKKVHYRVIPDLSAGALVFEAGELDFYQAPIMDYRALKASGKYDGDTITGNHITYFVINPNRPPLDNDKLREAIAYAIDKDAMNASCFDGAAEIAKFMERPSASVGAPSEGVHFSYDPERARKLVIEAGYEKGVHVGKIMTISGGFFEKLAQVLQMNLADVGITADVVSMESNTTVLRNRTQDYDIGCTAHITVGDYDNFRRFVHSEAKGSYYVKYEGTKFDYKKIDALFDQGSAEMDLEKRKTIYRELNDLIMKTHCWLPIFHLARANVWVKGLRPKLYPNNHVLYEWRWEN